MHGRHEAAGTAPSGATDASDARLLSRVADGDRCAFETLYRGYFPRLARFLQRMTHSVQLIEEIVNDTMLVVWQKAKRYDARCKVSTWIFAIAFRTACKALRSQDTPVDADPALYEADPACGPESELDRHRLHDALEAALAALPLEQRLVVQLTYFHDMGYAEIGAVLGCPLNTVKTRMFHARRRLAALLREEGETVG